MVPGDLASKFHWIVAELAQWRPVAESMSRLIDECARTCPHPNWERLRSLPYGNVDPLVQWLEPLFRRCPPPLPLKGLWFGLFNPIYGGETVTDIYISGSKRFNPASNRWATEKGGRVWWPVDRYARSAILADIHRIAYSPIAAPPPPGSSWPPDSLSEWDLGNTAEYPLALGYAAFAVRAGLGQIKPALVLGALVEKKGYVSFVESTSINVTVGFDSGDFLYLGEFGPSGFPRRAER